MHQYQMNIFQKSFQAYSVEPKQEAVLLIESHTAVPLPEAPLVVAGEKKNYSLENMFNPLIPIDTYMSHKNVILFLRHF